MLNLGALPGDRRGAGCLLFSACAQDQRQAPAYFLAVWGVAAWVVRAASRDQIGRKNRLPIGMSIFCVGAVIVRWPRNSNNSRAGGVCLVRALAGRRWMVMVALAPIGVRDMYTAQRRRRRLMFVDHVRSRCSVSHDAAPLGGTARVVAFRQPRRRRDFI